MSARTIGPRSASVGEGAIVLVGVVLVGALCGVASAGFLRGLDAVTRGRQTHAWLVWALPFAGLAMGLVLDRLGDRARGGTSLVVARLTLGGPLLPRRMLPVALFGTLFSHLFGASVGREGTAVQMGGSLAHIVARCWPWSSLETGRRGSDDGTLLDATGHDAASDGSTSDGVRANGADRAGGWARSLLLVAGVAGGFGAVFGTPWAGAVFAVEVAASRPEPRPIASRLAVGLVAAQVGHATATLLGATHGAMPVAGWQAPSLATGAKWIAFGVAMGAMVVAYLELARLVRGRFVAVAKSPAIRLFFGGCATVALWQLAGTDAYLGLGADGIARALSDPRLPAEAFALKLGFTALAIGAGFVGGEVTPLFFMGASLGNVLSRGLGLPLELGAGVGLVSAFGAAARTPVALSVLGVELFGWASLPPAALVLAVGGVVVGTRSLYADGGRPGA